MISNKRKGAATNAIILAFVQCLTILISVLQTMILSRELTEAEYGTYSQALLVANFIAPFLLLGLANAITYFSGQEGLETHKYINGIISLIVLLGIIGAIGILILRGAIESYFDNPMIISLLPIVAFFPLLLNLISAFQSLYVAEDMATSIAFRNAMVAIVQISIIAVGAVYLHDIQVIFELLLVMYILQIIIFAGYFRKKKYPIRIQLLEKKNIRKIFHYSIPLAFSTAIGTLSIYMDKLLIGKMMTVENFALYTNMSKELPFAFIVGSFTTVILPAFVKMHAKGDDEQLKEFWSKYLELGICITWILSGAAIICAKDLLVFLYSAKYAKGIAIFVVYLCVTMCRFSYFGIILSTYGETKIIMYSSLLSLACNFILNIGLFYLFGMIGPAIATLMSVIIAQMTQIHFSCKLLKCKWIEIFSVKKAMILLGEIAISGVAIRSCVSLLNLNPIFRLVICGSIVVCAVGGINIRRIKQLISDINAL